MAYDSRNRNYVYLDVIGGTWTGDGNSWTRQSPAVSPPARQHATMAFDGRAVLLFGGMNGTSGTTLDDTWTWDGSTWTQQTVATHPLGRWKASMARAGDAAHPTVVLFGGIVPGTQLCSAEASAAVLGSIGVSNCNNDPSTWVWTEATAASPAPSWTQHMTEPSPRPRFGAGMAYDPVDMRALLFGGFDISSEVTAGQFCLPDQPHNCGDPALNDTWSWDSTRNAWAGQAVQPPGPIGTPLPPAPSVRGYLGMASDRGGVVLFGGTDVEGIIPALVDTWHWDGSAWSKQNPAAVPSARVRAVMASDDFGGALLFGGIGCPDPCGTPQMGLPDAAWAWNGSTWAERMSRLPAGRDLAAGAFDPVSGQTVLFGGGGAAGIDDWVRVPLGDTWALGGSNWAAEASPAPGRRVGASAVYDAAQRNIVLFGGGSAETWTWDGLTSAWTQRHPATSPPARTAAAMAYDSARGRVVLFGGQASDSVRTALGDTWTWDGSDWAQQTPAMSPQARFAASMTYDVARQQTVLFGGVDAGGVGYDPAPLADTWTWDGSAWAQHSPVSSPSVRARAGLSYDPVSGRSVLFGGAGCATADGSCTFGGTHDDQNRLDGSVPLGDTWTWDGNTWTPESTTIGPSPRAGGVLAFDTARQQMVLFGGNTAPGGTSPFIGSLLNDTWTLAIVHPALGAALTPSSLGFAGQAVGAAGAPRTVTLTNTGTSPLPISAISIIGTDFAQGNDCPGSLAPADSCLILVTFKPSARGNRSGTLSVSDGAPGSPQTVSLSGVGLPILSGDAAALDLGGVTLLGGAAPRHLPDGGQGVCEAGPVHSADATTVTGQGLPGCQTATGGLPLMSASAASETVGTGSGAAGAHSNLASLSLLPGMGLGGADVLDAGGLDAQASASCSGTASGTPSSSSSIGSLNINGTRVATQPVGSRIIFNPTGRNPVTLYGNPVTVNPTGARVPMAIVTLNYSRYDPATNTQVSSPLEVEFPPGGALASVIVGRVFVSYASGGCN